MAKVLMILSTGFEEIEAITVIDILRRAGIEVTTSTINDQLTSGAHSINIQADTTLDKIQSDDYDMVVLPGGGVNTSNLASDALTLKTLKDFKNNDKYVAAICAAPFALHIANVLNDTYTCYPGFEKKIDSAQYSDKEKVIIDKKVITSQGPATAMPFALELVKTLTNEDIYKQVKKGLLANT